MASKEDIINLLRDLDSEFDEIGNYASEAESDLSNSFSLFKTIDVVIPAVKRILL